MIYYVVKRAHQYTLSSFIATFAPQLRGLVKLVFYEELEALRYLRAGTYIFSDIERLRREEAENAAKVWNALKDAPAAFRLLNHPTASMKRYELLRTLRELQREATHGYDVYRLTEARTPRSFPVFLREEDEHTGIRASIRLIHSVQELDVEIGRLMKEGCWRDKVIVVEFVDTSDPRRMFRKYSASIAHGRIFPEHVLFSREWFVKVPVLIDRDTHEEQERYLRLNPHEKELREVCALARIEYGRVDYAIKDGKVCIWEINTNPSLGLQTSDALVDQTVEMLRWMNTEEGDFGRLLNPVYRPTAVRLLRAMRRDRVTLRMRWDGRMSRRVLKYARWATKRCGLLRELSRL
jgi:hypothetical protein